jgi:competence protein ComEA
MGAQEFVSRYSPFVKKNWLPLSLGVLGLIFFIYGLIGLFSSNNSASDNIIFESDSTKQNMNEEKTILVDIEGAVVKSGVYKLPQDSRIQDGLVAAGGLSAKADREYISKNLNLAIKLNDGMKVYIPTVGEANNSQSVLNASSEGVLTGTLININTASDSELDSLPGIGPVTVKKIIAGRPYNSVDNLLEKKVVGAKVFDQIKDKITAY